MPKTLTIKDILKKDLLIVELPENGYYEVFKHGIYFKDYLNADRCFIEGSYTLLGSPDEIKEEDAEELVETFDLSYYVNYNHPTRGAYTLTATKSLLSAIESVIYWENPFEKPETCFMQRFQTPSKSYEEFCLEWIEAESRTFDRNRCIILVKN